MVGSDDLSMGSNDRALHLQVIGASKMHLHGSSDFIRRFESVTCTFWGQNFWGQKNVYNCILMHQQLDCAS